MANFFAPKTLPQTQTIEVTCPHCGQVASFPYGAKLAEPKTLICRKCRTDLRKPYLSVAVANQVEQLQALRKRLFLVTGLALASALLMTYLVSRTSTPGFWHYLLLAVGGFLFLGCLVLILLNQQQLTKLKNLAKEFALETQE